MYDSSLSPARQYLSLNGSHVCIAVVINLSFEEKAIVEEMRVTSELVHSLQIFVEHQLLLNIFSTFIFKTRENGVTLTLQYNYLDQARRTYF